MAQLSALDASFLRVESPSAHMHVGWVSTLKLPEGEDALDTAALANRVASRLHLAPRFRQRVVDGPLGLGEARWSDDPDFDLSRHVTTTGNGARVGTREFSRITAGFFSRQLNRDRPLWAIHVVPRLSGRRAAVLGKVHHAMVDGVAAVELGMMLFDFEPDAGIEPPPSWEPEPEPDGIKPALDVVADTALEQFRAARRTAALGLSPGRALRVAATMRRAAFSLAEDALRPAPSSYLNVPIGPRRTVATHPMPMSRLRRLKEDCGVSLNDVVLGLVAGALRRLSMRRREEPTDLRVMVPVNVRGDEESGEGGNRIVFAFVELPVSEPDTQTRIARIREQTLELKMSGRIAGSDMLLRSAALLPGPLRERAARLASSPRLFNLTVSNVPGPPTPLYAARARVHSIYPIIPIPDHHALSIGALSYDGRMHFSAYADPDALPGVGRLPVALEDACAELEAAAPKVGGDLEGG
jgi:diacylglycerol O-acyltransferase